MSHPENNILSKEFFDSKLFVVNDDEVVLKTSVESNQYQACIVYAPNEQSPDDLSFLEKILSAVQLNMKTEVLLVNITHQKGMRFDILKNKYSFNKVILFGEIPVSMGLHFQGPFYEPFHCNNCQFLLAHTLQEIAGNKQSKAALWSALQQMFLKK